MDFQIQKIPPPTEVFFRSKGNNLQHVGKMLTNLINAWNLHISVLFTLMEDLAILS